MTIRLCVLLWPAEGRDADLRRYEDAVLPLLGEHSGRLVTRETVVRASDDEPLEVQVIELRDQAALDGYLSDPRRLALEEQRAAAITRTQILRLG
ncbi:hypothetical protein [Amycolatopsis sp. GM8]|uniref:hypothetical protein n=1 Tax=Amycolatopsis sp. GM8 TaxID=2896530 RepID=UPI001F39862C|nr:hypothetical protein [Amycolatopsis sp. GM8]